MPQSDINKFNMGLFIVFIALIAKLKNTKMESRIMGDDKENRDECKMVQTDSEGNTNLCCCYILDQDDQYEDPCYLPVDDCCR